VSPRDRAGVQPLPLRLAYLAAVVLAVVLLVASMLTWNMLFAAISLVLAVVLFRNLDVVAGEPEGVDR
jgi:uncharacterized membrane protein